MEAVDRDRRINRIIVAISLIVPLMVIILFGVKIEGVDLSFLPPIYASINGMTAVLLIAAFFAIKQKWIQLHEYIMKTCIGLSSLFLIMYVMYHMTSDSTPYGGEGAIKYVYYFILITHIVLSVAVIPLVLFTFAKALTQRFEQHRRLARITFPIWLYVAVSGVIIYLMISPYYNT